VATYLVASRVVLSSIELVKVKNVVPHDISVQCSAVDYSNDSAIFRPIGALDTVSKEYADEINEKSGYAKTLQDIREILVMCNYNTEKFLICCSTLKILPINS
jgi:hypothetical protein